MQSSPFLADGLCPRCGSPLLRGQHFCPRCRADFSGLVSAPAQRNLSFWLRLSPLFLLSALSGAVGVALLVGTLASLFLYGLPPDGILLAFVGSAFGYGVLLTAVSVALAREIKRKLHN